MLWKRVLGKYEHERFKLIFYGCSNGARFSLFYDMCQS